MSTVGVDVTKVELGGRVWDCVGLRLVGAGDVNGDVLGDSDGGEKRGFDVACRSTCFHAFEELLPWLSVSVPRDIAVRAAKVRSQSVCIGVQPIDGVVAQFL